MLDGDEVAGDATCEVDVAAGMAWLNVGVVLDGDPVGESMVIQSRVYAKRERMTALHELY